MNTSFTDTVVSVKTRSAACAPSLARTTLGLIAMTVAVAACSGGGYSNSSSSGATTYAPTLSGLTDQSFAQDSSSGVLTFTVSDQDSDTATVTVTAQSANVDLISADGIVLGGSGGSRTITLTPNERLSGATQITVKATDPQGLSVQKTFTVNVTTMQVSFKDFTSTAVAADQNSSPQSLAGLSFSQDADDGSFTSVFGP